MSAVAMVFRVQCMFCCECEDVYVDIPITDDPQIIKTPQLWDVCPEGWKYLTMEGSGEF